MTRCNTHRNVLETLGLFVLAGLLVSGCSGTVGGIVQAKNADGSFGDPIEGASVTFVKEGESTVYREVTGSGGTYQLTLDTGRYVTSASHPDFEWQYADNPTPIYLVVEVGTNTANFFMTPD